MKAARERAGTRKRRSPKRRKDGNAFVPITIEPSKGLSVKRRVTLKIRAADQRFLRKGE